MTTKANMFRVGMVAALACAAQVPAFAASAITENFESGLSGWTDRTPANPQSVLVTDPLNAGNKVLSFSQLGSAGSILSNNSVFSSTGQFTLSFDYLGTPGKGGVAGNLGGFLGVTSNSFLSGGEMWLAGTGNYGTPVKLVDDGAWHSYTLTFNSTIGQNLRLKLEDFEVAGGVAGDVYFDNLRLVSAVPEPSSVAMALVGLVGLVAVRRRAKSV